MLLQCYCIADWKSFFIPCPLLLLIVAATIIENLCVGRARRTPGQDGGTLKSLSALWHFLWQEQSSSVLLDRNCCLSQGSRGVTLWKVLPPFVDELQLEGAASAEICIVGQHWGPWGEGVKVNCLGIP